MPGPSDAVTEPAADLDEIRALLAHLPGPDLDAGSAAATREAQPDEARRGARAA